MRELDRNDYYPWFEDSAANLPKDRYLNRDFLLAEEKRIEEAWEWEEHYRSADRGDTLPEYTTYIVPIEISKLLTKDVNGRGYVVKGTSALRNNQQAQKLALFPKDTDPPLDYSLIRIFEPKKEIVLFNDDIYGTDAIIVEDFETLDNDYIYRDLPSGDKKILDVLEDHLGGDKLMAQSLYSPMISSPSTHTDIGGIGSCSLSPRTRFGETLHDLIGKMLPREYTDYRPPTSDVRGYNEDLTKGRGRKITYKTAERIPTTASHVGLEKGNSYQHIKDEIKTRAHSSGEYSFFGNIVPSNRKEVNVAQDALSYFTQNEITISSYDELKEADVDLTRLENSISNPEKFWINIVGARQYKPSINRNKINDEKWIEKIQKDWDYFLPQMGYETSSQKLAELKAEQTYENVLRLAQKIARSERREEVTESDIKYAQRNFKHQAERLLSTDVIKDATNAIKRNQNSDEVTIIKTFLQSKPCTMDELVSHLLETRHFEDEESTEDFIQEMIGAGKIYEPPSGRLRCA